VLFQINFKSAKPVYLQLVDQVKSAAAAGLLRAGDALPSIRPLSEELRVNRNTVAKAYTQLEAEGIVESQQGRGCFVRAPQSPLRKDARRKRLVAGVDEVIVQAHHLQVPADDLLDLVRERFDALAARQSSNGQKQGTS
jgi:DNA-binding transcriptional regulator YhcF (GntR family)